MPGVSGSRTTAGRLRLRTASPSSSLGPGRRSRRHLRCRRGPCPARMEKVCLASLATAWGRMPNLCQALQVGRHEQAVDIAHRHTLWLKPAVLAAPPIPTGQQPRLPENSPPHPGKAIYLHVPIVQGVRLQASLYIYMCAAAHSWWPSLQVLVSAPLGACRPQSHLPSARQCPAQATESGRHHHHRCQVSC